MPLGNIAGAADELADVVGVSREAADRKAFSRDFNTTDFDTFGGAVSAGKYIEIARFEVPADTEYSWGYGRASAPENQGYLYVDLNDADASNVNGQIRFKIESATGRSTEVVKDVDTEKLDASKTDRTEQVPLPEQLGSPVASQDAYLVIELNASADADVSDAESDVIIPVTEYDLGQ